jgi:branched-chain amino acid transport system permease protein
MAWESVFFQLLNGVVWGLILALISLGLCLIYGLMGIINIAHGSLYMAGAVLTVYLAKTFAINFWVLLVLAPIAVAALSLILNGLVFERVVRRDPAIGLLATAGLLLILDNSALALFGGAPESVIAPLDGAIQIFGVYYPSYRLAAAGLALAVLLAVWALLRYTKYGLWMRAVPQARDLSAAIGVPIRRVNAVTVALGGLTAGLAGALVAPISAAHFQMGLTILASAFVVVVIGGLGSLFGAVVVALAFGLVLGLFSVMLTPTWAEAMTLLVMLPVLYFKPKGLFGSR